jgi:NAD(P)-dependent dehydrogenase (short-subunit alcohol dehydrogenase family)
MGTLRFILALLVMLSHTGLTVGGLNPGVASVVVFYAISGYVMSALVAKHFLPMMAKHGPICFAALSARVGSISDNSLGGWHSYRASKSALNMLIRNIAIEWQRKNPQSIIVGLHPGTVETALSAPFKGNPAHERFTPARAAKSLLGVLQQLKPEQSGQIFAYDGTPIAP